MKKDIRAYGYEELKAEIQALGEKPFRAGQIYDWLHVKLADSFDEMTNLSKDLRRRLEDEYEILPVILEERQISKLDGTNKFLFRLYDGNMVESVLMRYKHGNSVCISSQAGCRMGCVFCASTIGGLKRNLSASEMLGQIYQIQKISKERVHNVVVMGTGEPLDNYDNFLRFVRMLTDGHGLNISQRNVTVSTCGIVPKMLELAEEKLQITLALSLHGSTQEKRRRLMPVANRYDLSEVLAACDTYFEKTGRRVTFEYSLVHGVNDTAEDARELTAILKPRNCHLNLIPVNPVRERDFVRPSRKNALNFKNNLEKSGMASSGGAMRKDPGRTFLPAGRALHHQRKPGQVRTATTDRIKETDMRTFAITDVGMVRQVNQDYVFATDRPLGILQNLFVVADGMGGHQAGDYASKYTVEVLQRELKMSEGEDVEKCLVAAIKTANREIIKEASRDEHLRGMGTTVVAATIMNQMMYFANVGDSRLYLINQGIQQLTKDHSLVEEMVRLGGIKPEEAKHHPDKNIITRAIGAKADVDADFYEHRLKRGDIILMCTDGLSNMVEDEELFHIVQGGRDIVEAGQALVDAAKENGGTDNIGVVLVEPFADEVSVL